jgi:hypothetical protein
MRNIEINSDKFTVFTLLFFLVVALLGLIANLYGLLMHRSSALPSLDFGLFARALFFTFAAVGGCRDSKIRKAYPYGLTVFCLMAIADLVAIALQWANASIAMQNLFRTPITVVDLVISVLFLVECVRWFRARTKLAEETGGMKDQNETYG